MKRTYGILFRKQKNPKLSQSKSGVIHDIEYLDENSKVAKNMSKDLDNVSEDMNYLSKEHDGKVYVKGYLRDLIYKRTGKNPEALTNEERINFVVEELDTITKRHGAYRNEYISHKLIFTFSNEFQDTANEAGFDLDTIMHDVIRKTMNAFRVKFHKDDRIGYSYGIHHDTDNLHCHIYMPNVTENLKHIALSQGLSEKKIRKYEQTDHFAFIKDKLQSIENYYRKKFQETKNNVEENKNYERSQNIDQSQNIDRSSVKDNDIKGEDKYQKEPTLDRFIDIDNIKTPKFFNRKNKTISSAIKQKKEIIDIENTLRKDQENFYQLNKLSQEYYKEIAEKREKIRKIYDQIKENKSKLTKDDWRDRDIGGHVMRMIHLQSSKKEKIKKLFSDVDDVKNEIKYLSKRYSNIRESKNDIRRSFKDSFKDYNKKVFIYKRNLTFIKYPHQKSIYYAKLKTIKSTTSTNNAIDDARLWLKEFNKFCNHQFDSGQLKSVSYTSSGEPSRIQNAQKQFYGFTKRNNYQHNKFTYYDDSIRPKKGERDVRYTT